MQIKTASMYHNLLIKLSTINGNDKQKLQNPILARL